jgi:hypothetical protein
MATERLGGNGALPRAVVRSAVVLPLSNVRSNATELAAFIGALYRL